MGTCVFPLGQIGFCKQRIANWHSVNVTEFEVSIVVLHQLLTFLEVRGDIPRPNAFSQ
jgi:hypothetical protein